MNASSGMFPARPGLISSCFAFAAFAAYGGEKDAPVRPGEAGYLSGERIYELEDRPTPQCHASTIVETSSGLAAAWFGGEKEGHPSVGIWLARHDGRRWSSPVEVVDGSEGLDREYACGNPVLFQPAQGPLMLFYKVRPPARRWWGMLVTSDDDGVTWSEPRKLGGDPALGAPNLNRIGPAKNKPIQLADGAILCPSSSEHQGWRVHFERTNDLGRTWDVIGPISDSSRFHAIQPTLLRHPDRCLQILCRNREGRIVQSWSHDNGDTWSELTPTELPNPNSGFDAVTLADGSHLLVYNFVYGRGGLRVATSRDGKAWLPGPVLEKEKGAEFSYPAVIQASTGHVHITYTWKRKSIKHVLLDPAQLPLPPNEDR